MPGPEPVSRPFSYAVMRVVPRVERGERVNVGVILFCRQHDFLGLRTEVDESRLAALAPDLDLSTLRSRLALLSRIASGDADAGALARLSPSERFGWLVAPASSVIQPSEVHTGVTTDPEATLARLIETLVR